MTNQGYKDKFYDRMAIWVKKGIRDEYKQAAARMGVSLASLVQTAVEEYIENHGGEVINRPPKPETVTATERQLLNAFAKCPDHLKPTLKKLIEQIAGNEH